MQRRATAEAPHDVWALLHEELTEPTLGYLALFLALVTQMSIAGKKYTPKSCPFAINGRGYIDFFLNLVRARSTWI